jgi:4-amino-4-deoxy-L-arabinose transferase-like glycosyltransferase
VSGARNYWLIAGTVLCLLGLLYNFAGYPLLDPDEGRNAEIAREMAASGDYALPHLNDIPYLDKPIVYFLAGAATMKLLGPTELAARIPSLLFTLATIAVVAWFGGRLFGTPASWIAAIATAATPFTLAYSRTVIMDSAVTLFMVIAIASFYLAVDSSDRRNVEATPGRMEWWTTLAWVAIAFGVLTKGPVAMAVPLMIAIPFAIWRRTWRAILDPVALLLFAALVTPWIYAVSLRVPDFLQYALVTETASRLTTDELGRTGPLWYFVVIFPAAALPWSASAPLAIRKVSRWRDAYGNMDPRVVYLLLWIVVPLIFFSLSQSKRPQYVLPLIPAVALTVAGAWNDHGTGRREGAKTAAVTLGLLGLFFLMGAGFIHKLVPASPAVAAAIPRTAIVLGIACLVSGLLGWFVANNRNALAFALTIPVAAIPISSRRLMTEIGRERSTVEIARVIDRAAGTDARIVGINAFPPSLPFYLRRTIFLSSADGSEITSNFIISRFDRFAGRLTLREPEWWRTALVECTRPTAFVVRSHDSDSRGSLQSRLNLLIDTGKYAAYGPCGVTNLARAGN